MVLGLLLVSTAPRLSQTARRLRTEQAAFDVAQSLRYAHAEAVTRARAVRWSWDATARRASLDVAAEDGALPVPLRTPVRVPAGIAVSLLQNELPADAIQSPPQGTSDAATVLVELAPYRYAVTVDAVTSRVDIATASGT